MKKSAIFLETGYEECEALIVVDMLRRAGLEIDMVSMNDELEIMSSHNVLVKADKLFNEINPNDYDTLIIPGGKQGVENLQNDQRISKVFTDGVSNNKLICAICAGPSVLGKLGLLQGKKATCFPSFADQCTGALMQEDKAVQDGNIITGKGMGATIEFARLIIKNLAGEEVLANVEQGIQY